MSRRNLTVFVVGILTVAVTLLIFFMSINEITEIAWIGLLFIISAELNFFAGIILIDTLAKNSYSTMLRAGGFSTLSIYAVVAVLISLIFVSLEIERPKMLITMQLTILAIEIATMLMIASSAKSICEDARLVLRDVSDLQGLLDKVNMMMREQKNTEFTGQLQKIYDSIKYSDMSIVVESDILLAKKIEDLYVIFDTKDKQEYDVINLIERIIFLAEQRTIDVRSAKSVSI